MSRNGPLPPAQRMAFYRGARVRRFPPRWRTAPVSSSPATVAELSAEVAVMMALSSIHWGE